MPAYVFRDLRNYGVAHRLQFQDSLGDSGGNPRYRRISLSVSPGDSCSQSSGKPINQLTQVAFNCPLTGSDRFTEVAKPSPLVGDAPLWSLLFGVGNISLATAVARSSPPLPFRFILAKSGPLGWDFGVGHIALRAMPCNVGISLILSPLRLEPPPLLTSVGVGKYEHPISDMRSTNGCRRYAIPFRIVPAFGQLSEYSIHPPSKECCDVLQEQVSGSYLANQPQEVEEQSASLASDSFSFSGIGNILTGEPSRPQVRLRQLGRVQCGDVPPSRHVGPVLGEHLDAVVVNLDLADAGVTRPFESQIYATHAREHGNEGHPLASWYSDHETLLNIAL